MFKKNYEYILVLVLSLSLTGIFYFFISQVNQNESTKSKLQIAIENASHRWNDLFYKAISAQKPNPDVVVLAIDDESIIEVGRWPWSRSIITKMTEQLQKYEIKTLAYDIIFSEAETPAIDAALIKTISATPEKITFGTYSSEKVTATLPHQDFCMTQAFLYTGRASLAKINPFFSVDDDSNPCESVEFNLIFEPLFAQIDKNTAADYFKEFGVTGPDKLSQYQHNYLEYFKKREVYGYCENWLTEKDPYYYKNYPDLRKKYLQAFKAENDVQLEEKINSCIRATVRNTIPQYKMWTQNIKELQDVALYTGSFLARPDADGIIRNYPLIFRTGNQLGTSYIPSLALQSYLAATGYQALFKIDSEHDRKKVGRVEIKDVSGENEKTISVIPVDQEGKLLINYYGKQNSIIYVSAKELLNDSDEMIYRLRTDAEGYETKDTKVNKAQFLKNKNIIFGATAIGIYDIRTTPNDINYPGPETHATVLSNLFNGEYVAYDKYEAENAPYIFFIFILIIVILFMKTGIQLSALILATTMALFILLQNYTFSKGLVFHSSFLFLNLLFISFFVTFIYKYFFQSRKSKEMKSAFSKYVSKDVVEEILQNESAIELRGQKLHMSVYFSDIRGFTEFSEKMDPVELSEMLNKYFTPMSKIITEHQGTIDKYIGDAVMAMFGAPINYKDHAYQACMASLECIKVLDKINADFALKNWPKINIGIGVNSGFMNAGNIGSETIQNYTVIGDSVNLASRLEGLNKTYGTQIIISEFTYEIVKEKFICRELDKVNVKGKKELVTIYELVCTR